MVSGVIERESFNLFNCARRFVPPSITTKLYTTAYVRIVFVDPISFMELCLTCLLF